MGNDIRKETTSGVIWSAVERFSVQGIQFILSIIIARLVMPEEYGLIAMLSVFLAIAQCFIDSGFGNALIQKENRTEVDFSTVFYFNIIVAIIVYLVLYVCSPFIASFYMEPLLETITKIVGLNIIISSFSIVQRARLSINLDFKTQAKSSVIAVVLSGSIGVYMAYKSYGVWALVAQTLLNNFIDTILLWFFAKWYPKREFSYISFKQLFGFGSKLMFSGLMHTIYINLYSLVIGKKYSAADVGLYNRSSSIAQYPSVNIITILTRAMFPIQCRIQNDIERLSSSFHIYLRVSCYIIFPLMIGLAALSEPLINIFLTDKWIESAPLLSILSISYMFVPLMMINNQILNVRGRSDYFLRAEIIKKIIALLILSITIFYGLTILCLGILLYNIIDVLLIIYYVKKVIITGYLKQMKELYPVFLLSISMGLFVYSICGCISNSYLKLLIGFIIGVTYYILMSITFKIKEYSILLSLLKNYKKS